MPRPSWGPFLAGSPPRVVSGVEQRDRLGWVGVITDAKPEAVSPPRLGFVAVEGVREGLLHGAPLPMFVAIDTIASALDG